MLITTAAEISISDRVSSFSGVSSSASSFGNEKEDARRHRREGRVMKIGDPAPDFTLPASDGHAVSLADYRGKSSVVLIFYPKDQTPGCTKQLCAARDDRNAYAEAGTAVFGVNGDDAASHARFIAKFGLTMPLLVDADLLVAKAYDAVMGIGPLKIVNRTVVGIDRDGAIAFYKRGMPDTAEILAALPS
jgi:peroxiredoxin Q/BCP